MMQRSSRSRFVGGKRRKQRPEFETLEMRLMPCADELGLTALLPPTATDPGAHAFAGPQQQLAYSGSTGSTSLTSTASAGLSLPALSSLPTAPATLYLNFGGDFVTNWLGYNNITIPAFDTDGD